MVINEPEIAPRPTSVKKYAGAFPKFVILQCYHGAPTKPGTLLPIRASDIPLWVSRVHRAVYTEPEPTGSEEGETARNNVVMSAGDGVRGFVNGTGGTPPDYDELVVSNGGMIFPAYM